MNRQTGAWLRSLGFPPYIADEADKEVKFDTDVKGTNTRDLASKITHPAVVLLLGTSGAKKDMFAVSLCIQLNIQADGAKLPGYILTPEYSYTKEYSGHIIYMAQADEITPNQSIGVRGFIRKKVMDNNTVIMGCLNMGLVQKIYGSDFISSLSDRIRVIELENLKSIKLIYI